MKRMIWILCPACILFSLVCFGAGDPGSASGRRFPWRYSYAGTEHAYLEAISDYLLGYYEERPELGDGMIPCFTSLEVDNENEKDIKFWGIFDIYTYSLKEETLIEESGTRLLGLFRLEQDKEGKCHVIEASFVEPGDTDAIQELCKGHDLALEGMLHPTVAEESRRWYIAQFVKAAGIPADKYQPAGSEAMPICYEKQASPDWLYELLETRETDCILVVDIGVGSNAVLTMHEKNAKGLWEQTLDEAAFIGKNGSGKAREGDTKTPLGSFGFNAALGIDDDPGCPLPYTKVDASHYWDCDGTSARYNSLVSTDDYTDFHLEDAEHLVDYPNAYRLILNTTYNEAGTPGLGSAIFLHCYREQRTYTGGCISIPYESMKYVMTHIQPDAKIVIRLKP